MAAPFQIIDDDDGFDWEAAVREIDVACQTTRPSNLDEQHAKLNKPQNNCRQSTLDRFVNCASSRVHSENREIRVRVRVEDEKIEPCARGCYVDIDPEAARTWIYPDNVPRRDYQLAITKTALFSNTLVALPTGLGKTLIAAVVMYNYFRWFPEGKIVFAAPSRPLVTQQIEACHNVVGIPQEWTIDMTGQTSPPKRAFLWKSKRVFFVTPQVLEKDIQSGACLVKYLVCLVIDEAHRAMGNYSYCVAVRELMAVPVQLRILALTATPGSKQQTIQQVIDNLQISMLEYRNESDDDVCPYVHNRKIELIEVPMGKTAVEINNELLDVVRPIASKLGAMGLLQNRDIQTLSPCDLLNSRDRFRQAPPADLSHVKCSEVEGYFGVLITLYHIRKLLSSHGIRPAYEMLEEKMRQGSFARFMSRNEAIHRAKFLMQQSLSHGAPSPKLSKLIEVLVDHFKKNDPQSSRVIIFSNFRGSVRDIMDAVTNIGHSVKATQFIGQSSGKTLKGQSQKVQQAVLEKFRMGGYNVIVATSIGEEGLDIMEVDLVICFDANISPLRMIQRMGRTGRKHDGRVVVLACEGTELKGYMRKQATSKAVRKHMRNGGMNSFNFHPSPRMVPHVFKPEMRFEELSIKEFVRRGRKLKDDLVEEPISKEKLTDMESAMLQKYFRPDETPWKPSLIAFPHFQAFPSRVHHVMHSSRTAMLIDTMQILQGLSFPGASRNFDVEVSVGQCLAVGSVEQLVEKEKELPDPADSVDEQPVIFHTGVSSPVASTSDKCMPDSSSKIINNRVPSPAASLSKENNMSDSPEKVPVNTVPPSGASINMERSSLPISSRKAFPLHSYFFGSEVASVDIHGRVSIACVPLLEFVQDAMLLNFPKKVSCESKTKAGCSEDVMAMNIFVAQGASNEDRQESAKIMLGSHVPADASIFEGNSGEEIFQTPPQKYANGGGRHEIADAMADKLPVIADPELSPRLTNFIKSGFVPESPLNKIGSPSADRRDEILVSKPESPAKISASPEFSNREDVIFHTSPHRTDVRASRVSDQIHTPAVEGAKSAFKAGETCDFLAAKEIRTPLANLTNSSCSKDWRMSSSGEKSAEKARKLKRLRKIGDPREQRTRKRLKENSTRPSVKLALQFTHAVPNSKGSNQVFRDARDFIEEEAEVTSEAEVSDDEEDLQEDDTYEGSFIDDRVNPTAVDTQAENSDADMMAFYRRSLLSQSPIQRQLYASTSNAFSPKSVVSITESGDTSSTHLQTPQGCSKFTDLSAGKNSVCSRFNLERIPEDSIPSTSGRPQVKEAARQRKLCSGRVYSVPAINLEKEFSCASEISNKDSSLHNEANRTENMNSMLFSDDEFYEDIDLDELEAQAADLLKQKTRSLMQEERVSEPSQEKIGLLNSPSFDLGIS